LNPIKQLAGQTAVYGLSSVVARILNYFLVPLYTRIFSTGEYGVVTEIYAYVAILMVILTYGLETGYFRFTRDKANSHDVFSTAFISLLTTSSLFILMISLFSQEIARGLGEGHRVEFILLICWVIAIDALLALPYARLRHENQSARFALLKTLNISLNICFNLFFLLGVPFLERILPGNFFTGLFPVEFGIGYIFLSNLIASAINLFLFIPSILRGTFKFKPDLFRQMIRYSFPLLIAGLGGIINETIDRILLKFRLDEMSGPIEQIGIYGANIKIAVFMTLFVQMYRYAAEPFFFNQYNKSREEFSVYYSLVNRLFIYTGLFVYLGIVFFLDIFQFFVGIDFREGLGIVPIVLFSNLLLGVFFNLSFWYKLNDKTWYGAYLTMFGALITVSINFIFIPMYGYYASAWAHVICNLSMVVISFFYSKYFLKTEFKILRIFIILAIASVLYGLKSFMTFDNSLSEVLFRLFLLSVFILSVLKVEQFSSKQLKSLIPNKK
jgi:O-antigen/teichoic acid export membrane protein